MNKRSLAVLLLIAALFVFAGCGRSPAEIFEPVDTPDYEYEIINEDHQEEHEPGLVPIDEYPDAEELSEPEATPEPVATPEPAATPEPVVADEPEEVAEPDEQDLHTGNVICEFCLDHYVGEDLRRILTAPMNIRDIDHYGYVEFFNVSVTAFLSEFDNVYSHTYVQPYSGGVSSPMVMWSDETLTNFSFVSLELGGEEELYFYVREVLMTIDELSPNDAVVLHLAFMHYLIPRGGIIFTDAQGNERRFFIFDSSARGGCWPRWGLGEHDENWARWE